MAIYSRRKGKDDGRPVIEVDYMNKRKQFTVEIVAMILLYLKRSAEVYLGEEVSECIITYPFYSALGLSDSSSCSSFYSWVRNYSISSETGGYDLTWCLLLGV